MADNQKNLTGQKDAEKLALNDVVTLLYNMYDLVCPALWEHSHELACASEKLALDMGLESKQAKYAYIGSLFHDVGHLMVPAQVGYWAKGTLPPDMSLETRHPELGVKLLRRVKSLKPVVEIVKYHHENFNGTGFPDGLEGASIPLLARVVAVCHAYQTLIRGLASTKPMREKEAREIIREDAGITLDPAIVEVFIENLPPLNEEDYSSAK